VVDRDEIDALAGEYVLGTLDPTERQAAEARLQSDKFFRTAVARWERRLQGLSDGLAAEEPRPGLFDRIMGRIEEVSPPMAGNVYALRRSVRRWRSTAGIMTLAAAVLFGVVVLDRGVIRPQSEFVAVLTAEGAKPAFLAKVDLVNGTLSIRRVGAEAPVDKSYELWAVEPNAAPKSLGVVEKATYSRSLDIPAKGDLVLAISLEPPGGSPTGAPTGPIMFTGPLIPSE